MSGFRDPVAQFAEAIAEAGLRLRADPVMDGEWHRAAVEGDRGRATSGRYRGYLDGRPAGFIQNFKDESRSGPWRAEAEAPQVSPIVQEAQRQQMAANRARREVERAKALDAIAAASAATWDTASPAPATLPYLLRKRVSGAGLRVDQAGKLLVPMRDFNGTLRDVQSIGADGKKLFSMGRKGGSVAGLHLLLGEVHGVLLIAEGWATGATLHQATGHAVAVAFAKTNYAAIARVYAARHPGLRIAFCGDNDHHLPCRDKPLANVGKDAAEAAALDVGGLAILPDFEATEDGSDWNDFAAVHGLEAVRDAVMAQLAIAAPLPAAPPSAAILAHYPAPASTRQEALAALPVRISGFFRDAVRTASARVAWKAKLSEIEAAHEVGTPERRAALKAARREMAALYGEDWQRPGRRVLLPAAAGSGKSAAAAREVAANLAGLGNLFFATDKTLNAEAIAAKIPGLTVVRGRGADDPEGADGVKMCLRVSAAEKVAQAGLNVGKTLCSDGQGKTCPFFSECGWQRDRRRNLSGDVTAFAGSHQYLVSHGPMPSPDVIIIDEDSLSALIGKVEFGADRLLPTETHGYRGANLPAAMAYRGIMAKVANALRHPAGILAGLRVEGIIDAEGLAPAIAYLRAVEDGDFTGDIAPDMPDAEVIERLERHERSEIGHLLKLLVALQGEIALPRDGAHGVEFLPNHPVKVNGREERQDRIAVHYRKRLAFADDVPVLVLDASGDAEVYRRLFGDRLEIVDAVKCERNARVVQVVDVTMAKTSLLGTDRHGNPRFEGSVEKAARLRGEITAAANALAATHGSLFVATNMPVLEKMAPDLSDDVLSGHFGALRGKNDFEGCAAGLIVGREQLPEAAVEGIARALWADDPEPLNVPSKYEKATRGIRMRDGSAVAVVVDVHPDPRVQRVVELKRERESEQAVDRLRLIHNAEPKTIYLLCSLPLDMTVDRVITRRQLMHETTGAIDNGKVGKGRRLNTSRIVEAWNRIVYFSQQTGPKDVYFSQHVTFVLPMSRRELWRLAQDKSSFLNGLWDSERSIKDDLDAVSLRCEGWVDFAKEYLFAEFTQRSPVPVLYRTEPARASVALVDAPSEAEGKAELERLLGRRVIFYKAMEPVPELVSVTVPGALFVLGEVPPLPGDVGAMAADRAPSAPSLPEPGSFEPEDDLPSEAPAAWQAELARRLAADPKPEMREWPRDFFRQEAWEARQAAIVAAWEVEWREAWRSGQQPPAAEHGT